MARLLSSARLCVAVYLSSRRRVGGGGFAGGRPEPPGGPRVGGASPPASGPRLKWATSGLPHPLCLAVVGASGGGRREEGCVGA